MLSSIITEGSTQLNHPHQRQHHHRRHHPYDHQNKSDAFANVCCRRRRKGNWASLQFRSISDNRITSDHCQCLHSLDCKQPKKNTWCYLEQLLKNMCGLYWLVWFPAMVRSFGQHLNGWYCQYYIGNPCLWQDPLLLENYICTYALMNKPDPSFAILSTCQWWPQALHLILT